MDKVIKELEEKLRHYEKEEKLLNELFEGDLTERQVENLNEMKNANIYKQHALLDLCESLEILIRYNENGEIELYKENTK